MRSEVMQMVNNDHLGALFSTSTSRSICSPNLLHSNSANDWTGDSHSFEVKCGAGVPLRQCDLIENTPCIPCSLLPHRRRIAKQTK